MFILVQQLSIRLAAMSPGQQHDSFPYSLKRISQDTWLMIDGSIAVHEASLKSTT